MSAVHADALPPPWTTPPIAILDSGVARVPELDGRLRPGLNVITGRQDTTDMDGHGTAVAVIAAGQAGGIRGVSPTSPVIPIKMLDARGETSADLVVAALEAATKRGAKVINISAAAPARAFTSDDRKVITAIERAVTNGAVVIAPSGNEGAARLDIPAAYPHVVAVGGTDESGARAPFSNAGKGMDLVAPGASITSAAPASLCSTGYGIFSGTSFSAPAAAGAAALVMAARPTLDPSQVGDVLRITGSAPAWSPTLGFGLLDVPTALAAATPVAQPAEVDDDVFWARQKPPALSARRRRAVFAGRVALRSDPADVYRVSLRRGDRFKADLTAGAGSRISLGLWSPSTGDFDVTSGHTKRLLTPKASTRVRLRIPTGGTYYVSVTAKETPPAGTGYTLKLSR